MRGFYPVESSSNVEDAAKSSASASDNASKKLEDRFSQGDATALAEVYGKYFDVVFRALARKYPKGVDVEQVAADSFSRALARHARYNPAKGSLLGWLLSITRRTAASFCRSPQMRARFLEAAGACIDLSRLADPAARDPQDLDGCDEAEITEKRRDLVERALAAIPAEYRDLLVAWAESPDGKLPARRLAAAAGVTVRAIQKRKHRALASLEDELRRLGIDEFLRGSPSSVDRHSGKDP